MTETRTPYSPNQVAVRLGVSPRTVRRWIAEGRLPAVRYGRQLRIDPTAVDELGTAAGEATSWDGLSTDAFAADWDNELDADYDRWDELAAPT